MTNVIFKIIITLLGIIITVKSVYILPFRCYNLYKQSKDFDTYLILQQKTMNILITMYHFIVLLFGVWLILYGLRQEPICYECVNLEITGFLYSYSQEFIAVIVPIILVLVILIYGLLRIMIFESFDVSGYYEDIIKYEKQNGKLSIYQQQYLDTFMLVVMQSYKITIWALIGLISVIVHFL